MVMTMHASITRSRHTVSNSGISFVHSSVVFTTMLLLLMHFLCQPYNRVIRHTCVRCGVVERFYSDSASVAMGFCLVVAAITKLGGTDRLPHQRPCHTSGVQLMFHDRVGLD
jgi:hypothetical protein